MSFAESELVDSFEGQVQIVIRSAIIGSSLLALSLSQAQSYPINSDYSQKQTSNIVPFNRKSVIAMDTKEQIVVENRGPIKSIKLPLGWLAGDIKSGGIGQRLSEKFHPATSEQLTITVFYRGLPLNKIDADAFASILRDKPANTGTQILTPKEIRTLSAVMGRSNAGNNQFTNPDNKIPRAFHLRSAWTTKIKGRTVLAVDGEFIAAVPLTEYQGIFADTDGTGQRVQEIFLAGPPDLFKTSLKPFKDSLETIEWK